MSRPTTTALPTEDFRELSRGALVMIGVVLFFALAGIGMVIETGDAASAVGVVVMVLLAAMMVQGRRQLLRGQPRRAAMLLVVAVLAGVLASAPIPPPVPALAAAPIMAVAFALSFLDGRRLKVALIAAWAVSLIVAIIVEVTPSSPDLPAEFASVLRITTMAAVVGLVGLVLYRHRGRLEQAVARAAAATDALRESEARYRTVVEDVREVIFRIDADGRWSLLNHAWEELTGHSVAESLGRPVLDFMHADDRDRDVDLARPSTGGATDEYRREMRILGADGQTVWVEVHARPMRDEAHVSVGMSGTLTDVTVRRDLEERLVQQAFRDDLTGLANRALFKDRVEHAVARRAQGLRLAALLFLDLDRFKTVNDSLGHTAGDALLVAIAERLYSVLRPEDTIARLGGDEFGILVEDLQLPQEALALAERVQSAFSEPFQVGERQIAIRSSIGVVLASGGDRTADDLLRDADVAMYRAKVSGRGSYALFETSMQAEVAARLELESDLREAIEQNQLTLAYQPIIDLRDGTVAGVEALARWRHHDRGDVPPAVFIPSAEESGLILPLGRWVLRRACEDLAVLRRAGRAAAVLRMSVNVSPRQLNDPGFVEGVRGALRDADLPADALCIEVTESVVLDCGEAGVESLRVLRADGCSISLDDFGTGYSSLSDLRTLPIDELKIDRSFVAALLHGGVDAVVAEAVVRLGAALGVAVVAEGVEDAAVAGRLASLACPYAQGFHFGRPAPLAELLARLADQGTPKAAA